MEITVHKSIWQRAFPEIGEIVDAAGLSAFSGSMLAGGRAFPWVEQAAALWRGCLRAGGKRSFDIIVSLLLLLLTGPVVLMAMLAIWFAGLGREPVIYRQVRVGLRGECITLLKLRTMCIDSERMGPSMTSRGDPRITPIGRFLRRTRIDELPQLINVLRGDMSLVGPRPERPEFVAQYERQIEGYSLRHLVKPGITGLAQVSAGYAASLKDATVKLYYDLDYVRSGSLRMDLAILLRTVPVVLTGRGAR